MVINDNSIYCLIISLINRCRILSTQYRWYGGCQMWMEWPSASSYFVFKRLLWMLRFETAGRGRNTREGFHYYLQKPLFRDLENYRDFQGRELKVSVIFFSLSASQMRVKSEVVRTIFIFSDSELFVCTLSLLLLSCLLFSVFLPSPVPFSFSFFSAYSLFLIFFLLLQPPFHQLSFQHLLHHRRVFIIIIASSSSSSHLHHHFLFS